MERKDHCTHPEQTWCDCDWCRLTRAQLARVTHAAEDVDPEQEPCK